MEEILRAENISKTYQAGRVVVKALNRCSFSVERGEFVAVVGRSGSGKSTLLRILASFDKPDEGKVYVEGEDISGLKGKKLAQFRQEKIGFIYQDYSLFPEYTAYENVLLPLKIAHQAVPRPRPSSCASSRARSNSKPGPVSPAPGKGKGRGSSCSHGPCLYPGPARPAPVCYYFAPSMKRMMMAAAWAPPGVQSLAEAVHFHMPYILEKDCSPDK